MKENSTGFWVVIGIAIVGGVGYVAYNKYLKPKVNAVTSTNKFLGIF